MTASAERRVRPITSLKHKHLPLEQVRREYDGGRGATLAALAERWGIPTGTMEWYAAEQRWREDAGPRPPTWAEVVRYCRDHAKRQPVGTDPEALLAEYRDRFGDHLALPTARGIKLWIPKPPRQLRVPRAPDLVPIDGLTRRCQSDACQGLITTRDPCHRCGHDAAEFVASA